MKKLVFIAVVLCSCAIACWREDTLPKEGWRRTTEPRFTDVTWAPCKNGECADSKPQTTASCNGPFPDRAVAVDVLLHHDACLDNAIATLEKLQANDPDAKSDLAAAYYVRASRDNQPIDLLSSLNAADGNSPAAVFNRALAQEALGLYEESITTWEQVAKTDTKDWAAEAREHVARLRAVVADDAETRWKSAVGKLPALLEQKDRAGVAALVAEFPFSTQKYFERTVSPQSYVNLRLLATELSLMQKDPFDREVIDAIENASPERGNALREGHRLFAEGSGFQAALRARPAVEVLEESARQFERGKSPFLLLAELNRANALQFEDPDKALAIVDRIEPVAARKGYRHLLARIHGNRSNLLFFAGRPLEAVSSLQSTLAEYVSLGDRESLTRTAIAAVGNYRTVGQNDLSWAKALLAVRSAMQIPDSMRRHALYGDTAATAAALGFPRIALSYQNIAIRQLKRNLVNTTDLNAIRGLQKGVGIALRARAGIELQMNRLPEATADLNEAVRLLSSYPDDPLTKSLLMSLDATTGESLLRQYNPTAAAAAFASALQRNDEGKFHTFRARLFGLQAIALRRAGHRAEAKESLMRAIGEIRTEESRSLADRTREVNEESWSAYFSRFQDTYRILIGQLVEEHKAQEAFQYAESARGHEPLNLLSGRPNAPKALTGISKAGEAVQLEDIRKELPVGTFLFEYCVLDEQTFVWVISRDAFDVIALPVTRKKLEELSEIIQGAANRNPTTFDAVLFEQYARLIAAPLAMAKTMNSGHTPARLVIIPDGPMHGLPLGASRKRGANSYLVEEMPIEFDGSASLYVASLLRDRELRSSRAPSILLIGNPALDPKLGKFDDLTNADAEITEIAAIYRENVTSRSDRSATIPEFLRLAREAAIIHIAGHGIVDAKAPSRSAILLAPSPGKKGPLDAETLPKELRLDRTRLVILSACTSAGGLPVGPEGVAPLVRPIIAAGAPAVIGSLWDVRDDTPAELFVSFHKHYRKEGGDAAEALRLAQLEMLKKYPGDLRPAMTWTSFQVIGHASSPFAPRTTRQKEKPP